MEEDEDDILDDEYYEFEENNFLNERNVFNRVGIEGPDLGTVLISLKTGNYTQSEKFRMIAAALVNKIGDDEVISNAKKLHMLTLVEKIPDFEYKNASAFVMGYIVAINSSYETLEINREIFENILDINENIKLFFKIDDSDILRYTRLCLLHNLGRPKNHKKS